MSVYLSACICVSKSSIIYRTSKCLWVCVCVCVSEPNLPRTSKPAVVKILLTPSCTNLVMHRFMRHHGNESGFRGSRTSFSFKNRNSQLNLKRAIAGVCAYTKLTHSLYKLATMVTSMLKTVKCAKKYETQTPYQSLPAINTHTYIHIHTNQPLRMIRGEMRDLPPCQRLRKSNRLLPPFLLQRQVRWWMRWTEFAEWQM